MVISYLIAGGLTTVVSLGVYYGLVFTVLSPDVGWQLQTANVLSWIAAVTFAYITNKIFVFQSRRTDYFREAAEFASSRLITLFIDMAIMFFTVTVCGMNDKIAKLIVQAAVTILNYLFSKLFVFRKKKDSIC